MKKLLTILVLLMAVMMPGYAEISLGVNEVWAGSVKISWNTEEVEGTQFESPNGTFTGLLVGDKIVVTSTLTEGYSSDPQYVLTYKAGDSWTWTDLTTSVSDGTITYTAESEQIATEIAERGLVFRGQGYTITKIEVIRGYKITITSPTNGTITVKNGDTDVNSGDYVPVNTSLTLTAAGTTDYVFDKWTSPASLSSESASTSLTITEDLTIAATFKQMHSVTAVSESDAKGTVAVTNPADDNLYDTGSTITVTATPKSGYEFEKWTKTENASWSSTNNPLNIEDLSADWTLTVSFTDATFTAPEGETLLSSTIQAMESGWANNIHIETSTYNTYKAGDVVKVYVKSVSSGQISLKSATDGWPALSTELGTGVNLDTDATVYSYTLTTDNAIKLNSGGLIITGQGYTVWGVTIIPAPVKNLSTGSTKINGATSVIIHKEMFAKASVGDEITIHVSGLAPAGENTKAKYGLSGAGEDETHDNWGWIEGNDLAENATAITRTITTEDLTILKDAGLKIAGDGIYVCGDVTLTTNGEVPEAQTHGNPSFTLTVNEPVGGTIAIKKDSETVSAGAFDIDTELTLTATASDDYTFLKWQKNGADAGTDATLSITMSANTEITALFQGTPLEYEDKRTLFEGSVDINWSGVAIQPSTVGAILEAGEQLILTTNVAEGAYGQVVIRGADRSDAIEGSAIGGLVNGENVITLTSAMVEAMREEFGFWGADATLTKVVLYKPVTVFSEAGVADLTTMTESEGKSTLAVPHNEALKGNVLVVESNENATVKVTFSDNTTATNKPGDRKIGNPTGSQALVLLDRSKFIKTIEIDKAKAAITKIYMSSLTLFEKSGEDYIADLSLAKAMDNTTFDTSSYTIATTVAWSGGIQLDVLEGETVKGKELMILTESDADLKVTVEYESGDKTEMQDRPASKEMKVVIDGNRAVKQILIQPKTASVTKLLKVAVNASATPDPNVFSKDDKGNFVADLSMVKAEGAIYNNTTFTMVATDSWQGVTVTPGNAEVVKGKELYIEFDKAAPGYAKISYVDDETSVEGGLDAAGTVMKIALDDSKQISKIEIKLKEAGTAKFKKIAVNATETADESGDDDEEAIIDEKTGEADLNELSAQDDTKTTLTQNEDGSITMTTTEAYQAAQIWFNKPEKLAKGNVLIVDIAESGVNVTVTVKYTDGTESSMTSTAHAASSRHAAAAGTKISVPLETGKDVQNIEVKNAEAGTITIQKMVVTTKNIFTDGVADLSMAKPQSNAIYDTSTYSLAVTKGWTGITFTPLATEQVSGVELMLQFTSAAKVKVAVTYNEGEGPSVIMDEAAKYLQMTLDKAKTVKEIQIQPTAAGVVQFKSLAVNQTETENPDPDYLAPLEYGERRTLFESTEGTQLSWNDICQMAANYGAILEEREQIEVYISARTEDCEWPKVFIKDANGEECGTVAELSAVDLFPYMAKFKLTNEMVEQLRDGFSICGDGIIVTQVCLYKPAALKAGDIDVADLNGGYQSSYDATSKTITTTSRWAARGWDIGDGRYNGYDVIVVEFEAVDFPVTLRMEYVDADGATKTLSQGASAGSSQVAVEIPDDIQQINYVYLMYENPGTLILLNADVLTGTYIRTVKTDGNNQWDDGEGWYRLDGKRVSQPGRGIYIHNGKKIVIK